MIQQLLRSKPGDMVRMEYRGWAFLAKFMILGWSFSIAGLALWEPQSLMYKLMALGGVYGTALAIVMLLCCGWVLAQMVSRRASSSANALVPYTTLSLCQMGMALVASESGASAFTVGLLLFLGVGSMGGAVNSTYTD
ncbi:MAG: hypothetical protein AB7O55_03305 [Lautropia sp.]